VSNETRSRGKGAHTQNIYTDLTHKHTRAHIHAHSFNLRPSLSRSLQHRKESRGEVFPSHSLSLYLFLPLFLTTSLSCSLARAPTRRSSPSRFRRVTSRTRRVTTGARCLLLRDTGATRCDASRRRRRCRNRQRLIQVRRWGRLVVVASTVAVATAVQVLIVSSTTSFLQPHSLSGILPSLIRVIARTRRRPIVLDRDRYQRCVVVVVVVNSLHSVRSLASHCDCRSPRTRYSLLVSKTNNLLVVVVVVVVAVGRDSCPSANLALSRALSTRKRLATRERCITAAVRCT